MPGSINPDIVERLNRVFQDVFDDPDIQINNETTAEDIELWDSLNHINLVLAVEKEFGIKLNAPEVAKLENVGAMLQVIADRVPINTK
jgi:acyl carrier protein